jgi:hypothetical protein
LSSDYSLLGSSKLFLRVFVFLCLAFYPPAHAQEFVPEKFDKYLIQETLKNQEILREEMEQIRLEIQRI